MTLGSGSYGRVSMRMDKGMNYAVKKMTVLEVFKRETSIMKHLGKHDNVVELAKHDADRLELWIQPVMDTDLHKFTRTVKLDLFRILSITKQIVEGLAYIHSRHVIHRDLKPANILVGFDESLRICDFGMSTIIEGTKSLSNQTNVVTPNYRPPEVILGQKHSFSLDMWSAGCVIAEMTLGHPLFEAREANEGKGLMNSFARKLGALTNRNWYGVEGFVLYHELGLHDLKDRFEERSIKLGSDNLDRIVNSLLHYCPLKRWSSEEAKQYMRQIHGQPEDISQFLPHNVSVAATSSVVPDAAPAQAGPALGVGKRKGDFDGSESAPKLARLGNNSASAVIVTSPGRTAAELGGAPDVVLQSVPNASQFITGYLRQIWLARSEEKRFCDKEVGSGRLTFHSGVQKNEKAMHVRISIILPLESTLYPEAGQKLRLQFNLHNGEKRALEVIVDTIDVGAVMLLHADLSIKKPKFSADANSTFDCNIARVFNDIAFARQDVAVNSVGLRLEEKNIHVALSTMLGVEVPPQAAVDPVPGDIVHDSLRYLNEEQTPVFSKLLDKPIGILLGCAGTGKTHFLKQHIIAHERSGKFVFMGAVTNDACRDVAAELFAFAVNVTFVQSRTEEARCHSIPAPYTLLGKVLEGITKYGQLGIGSPWEALWKKYTVKQVQDFQAMFDLQTEDSLNWNLAEMEVLSDSNVVCSTLDSAGSDRIKNVADEKPFSAFCFDEAGKAAFGDVASVLLLCDRNDCPVLFAGDPFQLGPFVRSRDQYLMELSCLHLLVNIRHMEHEVFEEQSRMVEPIAEAASQLVHKFM